LHARIAAGALEVPCRADEKKGANPFHFFNYIFMIIVSICYV